MCQTIAKPAGELEIINRILTLLTFRPEFRTPWPAMAHQTSLALNRLTRRQVATLMRQTVGKAVPDSLVRQI